MLKDTYFYEVFWKNFRRNRFALAGCAVVAVLFLLSLLAPVERVTGYDTIMPLPRLEDAYIPGQKRILAAARRAMRHG